MTKYFLILLFCIILFSSCATTKFENRVSRIELGMTKDEIRSLLGKNYTVLGGATTPDGNVETWSYKEGNVMVSDDVRVVINFMNNKVDEWHREYAIPATSKDHQ